MQTRNETVKLVRSLRDAIKHCNSYTASSPILDELTKNANLNFILKIASSNYDMTDFEDVQYQTSWVAIERIILYCYKNRRDREKSYDREQKSIKKPIKVRRHEDINNIKPVYIKPVYIKPVYIKQEPESEQESEQEIKEQEIKESEQEIKEKEIKEKEIKESEQEIKESELTDIPPLSESWGDIN